MPNKVSYCKKIARQHLSRKLWPLSPRRECGTFLSPIMITNLGRFVSYRVGVGMWGSKNRGMRALPLCSGGMVDPQNMPFLEVGRMWSHGLTLLAYVAGP